MARLNVAPSTDSHFVLSTFFSEKIWHFEENKTGPHPNDSVNPKLLFQSVISTTPATQSQLYRNDQGKVQPLPTRGCSCENQDLGGEGKQSLLAAAQRLSPAANSCLLQIFLLAPTPAVGLAAAAPALARSVQTTAPRS